ncbi:hypothetical protein ACRBEV_08780 [Methylobacterium phyllosphaerae]
MAAAIKRGILDEAEAIRARFRSAGCQSAASIVQLDAGPARSGVAG